MIPGKAPLEKGMTSHSSILAWKIPWTEEPGRLPVYIHIYIYVYIYIYIYIHYIYTHTLYMYAYTIYSVV